MIRGRKVASVLLKKLATKMHHNTLVRGVHFSPMITLFLYFMGSTILGAVLLSTFPRITNLRNSYYLCSLLGIAAIIIPQETFTMFLSGTHSFILTIVILCLAVFFRTNCLGVKPVGIFHILKTQIQIFPVMLVPIGLAAFPQLKMKSLSLVHPAPSSDSMAFLPVAQWLKNNSYLSSNSAKSLGIGWSWVPMNFDWGFRIGDAFFHLNSSLFSPAIDPGQFSLNLAAFAGLVSISIYYSVCRISDLCSIRVSQGQKFFVSVLISSSSVVINSVYLQSSAFLFGLIFSIVVVTEIFAMSYFNEKWNFALLISISMLICAYPEYFVLIIPATIVSVIMSDRRLSLGLELGKHFLVGSLLSFPALVIALRGLIGTQISSGDNGFVSPFHLLPITGLFSRLVGIAGINVLESFNQTSSFSRTTSLLHLLGSIIFIVLFVALYGNAKSFRSFGILAVLPIVTLVVLTTRYVFSPQQYTEYRLLQMTIPIFLLASSIALINNFSQTRAWRIVAGLTLVLLLAGNTVSVLSSRYLSSESLRERSVTGEFTDVPNWVDKHIGRNDEFLLLSRGYIEQTELTFLLREFSNLRLPFMWSEYLQQQEPFKWSGSRTRFVLVDDSVVLVGADDVVIERNSRFRLIDLSNAEVQLIFPFEGWQPPNVNIPIFGSQKLFVNPGTTATFLVISNNRLASPNKPSTKLVYSGTELTRRPTLKVSVHPFGKEPSYYDSIKFEDSSCLSIEMPKDIGKVALITIGVDEENTSLMDSSPVIWRPDLSAC